MKFILLIIFPTLISARINIEIIPASDNKDASVLATGSDRARAESIDIKTFHLTDNEVMENLKTIGYIRPGLIEKELKVVLKPISARIVRNNQRVERIQQKYYNKDNSGTLTFEPDVNHKFEETIRTRWYETQDISVGRNIDIKTSNDRINRASAWGQDDYESKKTKLNPSDVAIPLNHMQNISSVIHATLSSTEIRVDYEASLEGKLTFQDLCNYFIKVICLKSHELEINDYFHYLEMSNPTIKAHQIININYYRDIQLTVTDMSNGSILYKEKLELEAF